MSKHLIQWPRANYWDRTWNPVSRSYNPPKSGVVFCGRSEDLFDDRYSIRDCADFIGRTLGNFDRATYLWLTRFPCKMHAALIDGYIIPSDDPDYECPFRHCEFGNQYFGVRADCQRTYDIRLEQLMAIREPWADGWLLLTPTLGPVDLHLEGYILPESKPFKWVVVDGANNLRQCACKVKWIERIAEQCTELRIPLFVRKLEINGKMETDINKFPKHLRIRQVPWATETK